MPTVCDLGARCQTSGRLSAGMDAGCSKVASIQYTK